MKRLVFSFLIIFIIVSSKIVAQSNSRFYLVPHLGGEFPFSYIDRNSLLPPYVVRSSTSLTAEKAGLSLLIDIKDLYTFEMGYGFGNIGWGVIYEYYSKNLYRRDGSFRSPNLNRIYLNFTRPVYNIVIPKSNLNANNKFWAIFDVSIMLGFSRENLNMMSYAEAPFSSSVNSDYFNDRDSVTVLKNNSYSAHGGASLQFYHKGKKRLQLSFLYHQGLSRMVKITKSLQFNDVSFADFDIYTRGSMFAFYAAYPLLID